MFGGAAAQVLPPGMAIGRVRGTRQTSGPAGHRARTGDALVPCWRGGGVRFGEVMPVRR
ncbi:hypothetical protein SAMN05421869_104345 [Nonomuraea jiangxiensis]|uniref:Uncharacterized protein n=1 Tax=Nonomuraea jiangxiensis TaxID=633440 RepID=A0A1G8I184_9ACTN|nr:hypothetical protein SAMN05421869_104345 [Nonomuraea jiangxiensis]